MTVSRIIAVVTTLGFVTTAAPAHALLCKNKKGKLTVRATCKKKEVPLASTDVPQPPPATPIPGGPRVLDSKGAEVGALMSTFTYYGTGGSVLREIGGGFYTFNVKRSGLSTLDDDDTFFTYLSPNCTGTQYIRAGYGSASNRAKDLGDRLATDLTISANGTTGYYFTEEGLIEGLNQVSSQPQRRTSSVDGAFLDCFGGSVLAAVAPCDPKFCDSNPTPPRCFCQLCCIPLFSGYSTLLAPVKTLDVGSLGLTPPFKIER